MLVNKYKGSSSIKNLNSVQKRILYEMVSSLNIANRQDQDFKYAPLKEDLNLYDLRKNTNIVFGDLKIGQISKLVVDMLGNYVVNRFFYENQMIPNSMFNLYSNNKFKINIVDGMSLVDMRLTNTSLQPYTTNESGILFIISRVIEASYKNYHLVINDVIRAREMSGLCTVVFFNGTKKEAASLDYLYTEPREIDLTYNKNREVNKPKQNMAKLDDVLGGRQ